MSSLSIRFLFANQYIVQSVHRVGSVAVHLPSDVAVSVPLNTLEFDDAPSRLVQHLTQGGFGHRVLGGIDRPLDS